MNHGSTCEKVPHTRTGYLHAEDDDTPYVVDGLMYCGRCHLFINKGDGFEPGATSTPQMDDEALANLTAYCCRTIGYFNYLANQLEPLAPETAKTIRSFAERLDVHRVNVARRFGLKA